MITHNRALWRRGFGRLVVLACLCLLCAIALCGCQVGERMGDFVDADWGRGEPLGQTNISNPPALVSDATSRHTFLAWPARTEQAEIKSWHIILVRLDNAGMVELEMALDIAVTNPSQVALTMGQDETLHLAWLDTQEGYSQLYYARLDQDGALLSAPQALSDSAWQADSFCLLRAPDGAMDLVWSEKQDTFRLRYRRLDALGVPVGEVHDLGSPGFDPALRYDQQGQGHLIWLETPDYGERSLWYATLDVATGQLASRRMMSKIAAPLGLVAHRPALGLDRDTTYLFWSIERRGGGLTSPAAWSYVLTFPTEKPELATEAVQIEIPATIHLRLVDTDSAFDIHQIAPGGTLGQPARFVYLPDTNETPRDELATTFSVQMMGRTKSTVQIMLTLWQDGHLKGYQVAGKTSNGSLKPNLHVDQMGNLHVAWLDTAGFGDYAVYHASTVDAVAERTNKLRSIDLVHGGLDVLWGVVQALSFLPLAFVWIFVPVVLLVAYALFRAEGRLDRAGPRILLGVAILIYTLFKYWFQPGWLTTLPLPASLSAGMAKTIILLMPLVVSLISSLVTWRYARRRESPSIFSAFATFAICDALITMIIYVPGIMAE